MFVALDYNSTMVRVLLLFFCFLRIWGGWFVFVVVVWLVECFIGLLFGWFIGWFVGVTFLERNQLQCLYVLPDGAPNITGFSPLAFLKFQQNIQSVLESEEKNMVSPKAVQNSEL